ncbi:MAG: hypothetical protein ACREL9_00370 [Gemmatimonadales bacterium]
MRAIREPALASYFGSLLAVAACGGEPVTAPRSVSFSHTPPGGAILDQAQPTADATAPFTIAIGGPSGQIIAQVFTAGTSAKLRLVEIPVGCTGGSLLLEIHDAPSGVPGSTVLASTEFGADELPVVVSDFIPLRVRPSPELTAGAQYAFVLSNPGSPAGSCGLVPGPAGDPYAGGNGYFFDTISSTWVNISLGNGREDLPFFTYVKP